MRDVLLVLGLAEHEATSLLHRLQAAVGLSAWSDVVEARAGVPPEATHPVPRPRERGAVLAAVEEGASVVVIEGMPGSGKSHLARDVAESLLARRQGTSALSANLRGFRPDRRPPRPEAVLEAFLRLVGTPARQVPHGLEARRRALAAALADRPAVVILDDVPDAALLAALAPAPGTVVLATTRTRIDLDGARRIVVEPFEVDEALHLLGRVVGPDRVGAEPDAARALVDATGRLPLAVEVTAARVASRPDWSLADHVEATTRRLGSLRLDDAVRTTLELSYAAIGPAARTALRLAASQPCSSLDVEELAALTGSDDAEAEAARSELESWHLLGRDGSGNVRLHDLVRAFGADRSHDDDAQTARDRALHRLRSLWAARIEAADRALRDAGGDDDQQWSVLPLPDAGTARGWLGRGADVALLLTDPETSPGPQHVVELSAALRWWLNTSGEWRAARTLHERALDAASRTGSARDELDARLALGMVLVHLADWTQAEELLVTAHEGLRTTDEDGAGAALNALAVLTVQTGRLDEGIERFRQVVDLRQAAGKPREVALARDNLAIALRRADRLEEALREHERAAQEAATAGDEYVEAAAHANMSDVLLAVGRPQESAQAARRALEIAHRTGHERVRAYASTNLGSALVALGQPGAVAHHEEALALGRTMGDRHLEGSVLNSLGVALLAGGEARAARARHTTALALAREVGDTLEEARALDGLRTCDDAPGGGA